MWFVVAERLSKQSGQSGRDNVPHTTDLLLEKVGDLVALFRGDRLRHWKTAVVRMQEFGDSRPSFLRRDVIDAVSVVVATRLVDELVCSSTLSPVLDSIRIQSGALPPPFKPAA